MKRWPILCAASLSAAAGAQTPVQAPDLQSRPSDGAIACAAIADASARLACFDTLFKPSAARPEAARAPIASSTLPASSPAPAIAAPTAPVLELSPAGRAAAQPSEVTRFWDLEKASAREPYQLRGYRPVSLSLSGGNPVNTQPSSPTNGAASSALPYSAGEMKINLSVRTKLASGLLHRSDQPLSDSIWFGYSQQSYWQLFNSGLSRPFRATDHEPEIIYVFGHNRPLLAGWTYRMSGAGLVHQSNGQSLPISRSWNRVYLMAAADKITASGDRLTLQAKGWQRLPEKNASDDNPDISNLVGRAEISGRWSFDRGQGADARTHTVGVTLRHSLRREANGSVRIEYLRSLGDANSGLRFHTQLFSGFGDSLIDYNRRRTVLSVGMSLVDW
jgi:phospholipase A1/A2